MNFTLASSLARLVLLILIFAFKTTPHFISTLDALSIFFRLSPLSLVIFRYYHFLPSSNSMCISCSLPTACIAVQCRLLGSVKSFEKKHIHCLSNHVLNSSFLFPESILSPFCEAMLTNSSKLIGS